MKFNLFAQLLLLLLIHLTLVSSHGIHAHDEEEEEGHDHEHEHEHEHKEYESYVTIIGIVVILICSFIGTVLPIVFKNKPFFHESTNFFGSVKLFGTGIILSTAFIHMLAPSDQLLTSEYSYEFFHETYPCFAGAFAIIGVMLTHVVQVISNHILCNTQKENEQRYIMATSDFSDDGAWKQNNNNGSHSDNSNVTIDISDKRINQIDNGIKNQDMVLANGKNGHSEDDGCAGGQFHLIKMMMENKEKQVVCYLLEMGISLHSVLIGIAFGLVNDEELIVLMVAMMFHQFFEGVALSSVFIEAHFKKMTTLFLMVILYTCTMPLGGVIGLLIRKSMDPTDVNYISLQGAIDAVAAGVLIYDTIVNILSRHCNSDTWKKISVASKSIQLVMFYLGLATMAIIGLWA